MWQLYHAAMIFRDITIKIILIEKTFNSPISLMKKLSLDTCIDLES